MFNNDRIGSAKTDPVRFKWGFGEARLKDKFAFFEASKNPIPKRRRLLAKCTFLQAKRALFETPFKLDRVSFSTPDRTSLFLMAFLTFYQKKNWRQIWRVAGRESGSPELLGSPQTSPEVPRTSPEVSR